MSEAPTRRCIPGAVRDCPDYLIDKSQDLADTTFQAKLHEDLKPAVFIAAALDCSTKSRIREKAGVKADGTPLPPPLRLSLIHI